MASHKLLALLLLVTTLAPGCKRDWGKSCEDDSECQDECIVTGVGLGNQTPSCTLLCEQDADCGEGGSCYLNYCALTCASDDECPGDARCDPTFELCAPPCSSNADCGNNTCNDGVCV